MRDLLKSFLLILATAVGLSIIIDVQHFFLTFVFLSCIMFIGWAIIALFIILLEI